MQVVARFHDAVRAQQLAGFLNAHGIAANVSGGLLESFGAVIGAFKGQYAVEIQHKDDLEPARTLVAQFLDEPPELDEAWESATEPDLTKLDPKYLPDCPACGLSLRSVPADGLCPSCGMELDLVQLIVDQYGPEALQDCVQESSGGEINQQAVQQMDIPCPRCQYSLRGLKRRGTCPECGLYYDKCPGVS